MPAEDYMPEIDNDEGAPGEVTCRYCGAESLEWVHTGVRWRLVGDGGHFHVCPDRVADDFEALAG